MTNSIASSSVVVPLKHKSSLALGKKHKNKQHVPGGHHDPPNMLQGFVVSSIPLTDSECQDADSQPSNDYCSRRGGMKKQEYSNNKKYRGGVGPTVSDSQTNCNKRPRGFKERLTTPLSSNQSVGSHNSQRSVGSGRKTRFAKHKSNMPETTPTKNTKKDREKAIPTSPTECRDEHNVASDTNHVRATSKSSGRVVAVSAGCGVDMTADGVLDGGMLVAPQKQHQSSVKRILANAREKAAQNKDSKHRHPPSEIAIVTSSVTKTDMKKVSSIVGKSSPADYVDNRCQVPVPEPNPIFERVELLAMHDPNGKPFIRILMSKNTTTPTAQTNAVAAAAAAKSTSTTNHAMMMDEKNEDNGNATSQPAPKVFTTKVTVPTAIAAATTVVGDDADVTMAATNNTTTTNGTKVATPKSQLFPWGINDDDATSANHTATTSKSLLSALSTGLSKFRLKNHNKQVSSSSSTSTFKMASTLNQQQKVPQRQPRRPTPQTMLATRTNSIVETTKEQKSRGVSHQKHQMQRFGIVTNQTKRNNSKKSKKEMMLRRQERNEQRKQRNPRKVETLAQKAKKKRKKKVMAAQQKTAAETTSMDNAGIAKGFKEEKQPLYEITDKVKVMPLVMVLTSSKADDDNESSNGDSEFSDQDTDSEIDGDSNTNETSSVYVGDVESVNPTQLDRFVDTILNTFNATEAAHYRDDKDIYSVYEDNEEEDECTTEEREEELVKNHKGLIMSPNATRLDVTDDVIKKHTSTWTSAFIWKAKDHASGLGDDERDLRIVESDDEKGLRIMESDDDNDESSAWSYDEEDVASCEGSNDEDVDGSWDEDDSSLGSSSEQENGNEWDVASFFKVNRSPNNVNETLASIRDHRDLRSMTGPRTAPKANYGVVRSA